MTNLGKHVLLGGSWDLVTTYRPDRGITRRVAGPVVSTY